MKLSSFSLLRVHSHEDSPFCFELLVKNAEPVAMRTLGMPLDASRCLLVCGASVLLTHQLLRSALSRDGGSIEAILEKRVPIRCTGKKHSAVRFVHVVFSSASGVQAILQLAEPLSSYLSPTYECQVTFLSDERKCRMARWILNAASRYTPSSRLTREVTAFMASYDLEKEAKKQSRLSPEVDDDGFTVVKSKSTGNRGEKVFRELWRYPGIEENCPRSLFRCHASGIDRAQTESVKHHFSTVHDLSRRRKKRGGVEVDFYRFQRRERKRQELIGDQKRAEERIREMNVLQKMNAFAVDS